MAHDVHSRRLAGLGRNLARAALLAGFLFPIQFASRIKDSLEPTPTVDLSSSPGTASSIPGSETPASGTGSPSETSFDSLTVSPMPSETATSSDTAPASSSTSTNEPPSPSATVSPTAPETATLSETVILPSPSPSPSGTASPPVPSPSPSPTLTLTSPPGPTPAAPGIVLIHEIAWAGTIASASDEWIELHNAGTDPVDLTGWRLTDHADISILLRGVLPAGTFYLLERTDDRTVSDVPAQQIYTGSLSNSGESLTLTDSTGATIDTANRSGGTWPGGSASTRASMERRGPDDVPAHWGTASLPGFAHDAAGHPIVGTPGGPNSVLPPTLTPSPQPTPIAPGSLWINEVAWPGTAASSSDEWIELHNPGSSSLDLTGWRLSDSGDISIRLAGSIQPFGFFLLERTDDTTISDIAADQIYSGGLSNVGEILTLTDPSGSVVDTANSDGGSWPAGGETLHQSMERRGAADIPGNWSTFTGYFGAGRDAAGGRVAGSPRNPNSFLFPTPSPTWIPGRLVINEVLPRARYDWEGAGGVNSGDEFIELMNVGPGSVRLGGWTLDDFVVGGSRPYTLPNITVSPGGYAVFFRTRSHIALNDPGDSIRLAAPDGQLIDKVVYIRGSVVNLAYGRSPDASNHFSYCLWPTPGKPNELFHECRPAIPPVPRLFPPETLDCHMLARGGPWMLDFHRRRC